jgi:hypothetical protein
VEEPAVEHGVEPLPEMSQLSGVLKEEPRRESSVARLLLSGVECVRR